MGFHFDLLWSIVRPATTKKMDRLLTKVSPFLHNQSVPAQAWESLLGLLNQLEAYVPWGQIHILPIHQNLLLSCSPQKDPHDLPISVWKDTREAIQWSIDRENFFKGCPIYHPTYQYRCFHGRMGCPYGPMQNLWVMVLAGTVPPHHHPGNESHQVCSHAVQPSHKLCDPCQP